MPKLPQKDELIRYHVLVPGKVQGVGYRMSVLQAASRLLQVNGWMRNLPDGRVEAVFEGNSLDIEKLLRWCRYRTSVAVVKDIVVERQMPENCTSFEIHR